MKNSAKAIFILLGLLALGGIANAATVTAATGGGAIASNTAPGCSAAGTWTSLTGPTLAEAAAGEIGLGNIVLTAPAGFAFNTAAAVTILLTGNGTNTRNINNIVTGTSVAVGSITATAITFTVTKISTRTNTLTWQGIQVRPTVSTPLATGNITETGPSTITGVTAATNFGTLTEVTSAPACNPTVPTVTSNAATALTTSGATLNGTVSSNGASTTVTFDYGLTTGYGSSATASASPLAANAVNTAVSAALAGLTCATTYHFRAKGVNSVGTTNGSDLTFATSACPPPAVTTNAATALSATGATLNGTVSSNGSSTTVTFDYGLTTGYGSTATATASPLAANAVNTAVSAAVVGLACGTTYHFRANGVNSGGTTNGGDITFTTSACPFSCTQPSNTPAGLTLSCQCDTFQRATLNPSTIFGGNWVATTSGTTSFLPQIVNPGYMRLTDNNTAGNEATAATVPGIFPAAGNYISVEFLQYAYNGTGADGIAVTLSDYSVPAAPGAFGGSLGYAQKTGINGFAGGWIGVALDEFGNYQNATEGRVNGPGSIPQSVGVRGSGSGVTGYPWLTGTANLTTVAPNVGVANSASATPSYGDYYQVIVDSRGNNGVSGPAFVSVNRDITGIGNAYSPLISSFDAYAAATAVGYVQAPVPQNWQVSFTGSTGGSYNIHEIGGLRICAQTIVPTTGGTPGGFNAIDEVYTRSDVNAVSGHLYTKLAGTAFTVKVAALNATGSGILTTYALSGNKTVTVKLIDDSVGVSCNASAAACSACGKPVVATQTMTFVSGDTGFKQSGNFTVPAYANLIAQMTDGTTTGCSVDAFAVRPSGIASVISSNATNTTTAGTPIFKAGSDNFSLTATTTAIAGNSGYAGGVPKINANGVQAFNPATVAGAVAGSFAAATSGTAVAPSTSSATSTGGTFTYSEVGAFYLRAPDFTLTPTRIPGVYDDTWTAVDSGAKNDCVSGTTAAAYSNTKDVNGKYGCNFGISANTGAFGRFVPDHFDTIVTPGMPCPAGLTCPTLSVPNDQGFIYSGQAFTTQVTARNAGGGVTQNYDSAKTLSKPVTLSAWNAAGGATSNPGGGTLASNAVPSTAFNLGVATTSTPIYTFPTTPVAPTDIYVRALDTDNVTSLRGVSSIEGGIKVVSGRVRLSNAFGSELLPLPMAATVQYYQGTNWLTSTTDSITSLALALNNYQRKTGGAWTTALTPASGPITAGILSFNLSKPTGGGTGSVDVIVNAPNYLLTGSNVAGVNPSNTGRATFGIYKNANEFIYLREMY